MTASEKYQIWRKEIPVSDPLYPELIAIEKDSGEMEDRFGEDLTFGTAGLRGIMGAGTNRMNIYTVSRAAKAYGQYIRSADLPDSCAIAYDTRNNSALFAQTCAAVLAGEGIHVYLYAEPAPTPMLSFAVRHLHTGGGVVITASHNRAPYNGMKCYGPDGCQQTDDPAAEVYRRIEALPMIVRPDLSFEEQLQEGAIEYIPDSVWEAYYSAVLAQSLGEEAVAASGLHVLYTPLHGTGLKPVTTLFQRLGIHYDLVTSQITPDGNFLTCPYPNPETAEAFDEAKKIIVSSGDRYDLVVATDPDADRLAVAVPVYGGDMVSLYRISGNELGCLLLDYILENLQKKGTLPQKPVCIKSIVTTPMVYAIASNYGCAVHDVLTGFKYIGSDILSLEEKGREGDVVFSYEESCGFLRGTYVRDKDAQVASMLACELAASLRLEDMNLLDKLHSLSEKYGWFAGQVLSIELDGAAGKAQALAYMDMLRNNPLKAVAGQTVTAMQDYRAGEELQFADNKRKKISLPKSNVLAFVLGDSGARVIFRPSGTEPKLKIYFFAVGQSENGAQELLAAQVEDIRKGLRQFGIKLE